ncbi:HlyC/CorC family transporter [Bosea sp. BIWAKO-01]|uniref:HlyC/CorC family transporter n=1 Tax=Bosea sp. BIWAKO-01 TaxID=506668 RepID=UPI000853706B|nr:HlyC/CorC family transporter [Bosea sp. BIWAKO-01]GAU82520.1 Co2 transporter containing CBS domains [Bosea sp. BIWAKO-01]
MLENINPWLAALIVLICLLLSAFFSGSETALTAASKARIAALEKAGSRRAGIAMRLLAMRERLIGAMLIGNNVVNIGASAFATSVLVAAFGDAGVIYATAVMSVLVIIFAEIMPKTAAIAKPDQAALRLARPVAWVVAVLGPLTLAIEWFVRRFLRLFGIRIDENQSILTPNEELRGQVDLMHQEGAVKKADRDMLGGLLDLKELGVEDVMIHRTKMRTINLDIGPEAIVREVLASPYTRMPLWRDKPENIVGILHAKDLLRALDAAGGDASKLDVAQIALAPWFTPVTTSLPDQLKAFLARKTHFALVVDEYGEVMGLVTLEDILEEIVGDIRDEHDIAVPGLRQQVDGSVVVDGGVPIRDLNRAMDWDLPDEEATTIAGLVIHEARTIPEAGQAFTFHGFKFEVVRKSRNRVTSLRITPLALALAATG